MFKKIFIDLCNQKGESPSSVCRKVGITPATFSGWTETTIPRQATLQRIADYFGVTTDYLLTDDDKAKIDIKGDFLVLFYQLSPEGKKEAETYLRFLAEKEKQDN